MKLLSQTSERWQYELHPNEADILLGLIKRYPFTELGPAEISKDASGAQAAERKQLLAESMQAYREELTAFAKKLLGRTKWKKTEKGLLLTLNAESREILLQILNDIRVGCWRALGEPEELDEPSTKEEFAHRNLMNLAGYFEMSLLEPEE
jgi:hypothetical protein